MTIQEAVQTAIAGGYQMQGSDGGEIALSGANNAYSAWTRTDTLSAGTTMGLGGAAGAWWINPV